MSTPEPRVTVTRYDVSCLPQDDINALSYTVHVEYAGYGRWAVRRMQRCYDIDGREDWEPIPSEREDEWLARFRHDLPTALEIAKRAAPLIRVNGHSVADVLAFIEEANRG
ncbi:hypothetical protein NONO_c17680 [Nocardia nova SH22a]|uniref:Uncharacterized protein n=1 Tax=Nocardia nova SH22a TaxID=1415166 RepID=W5TC67_9NOCA|nr:hypothetical protein [Nocardia nova]AHH16568.1 hypothetical protein NONO_c17680 [Nocardia nova SH22a]